MAINKWSNVGVAMQSALAAVKTITGITKASPGVATSTAHGLSNGTVGVLSVVGMYQLDQKIVRIANQAANTFELEGIDTTNFDTFVSGTFTPITFGTNITTATSITSNGGDFDLIDPTTIHVNPADAGLLAMKVASDSQSQRAFRFTFGTGGRVMYFYGYVGASLLPAGQAQGVVTTETVITMNGTPTYYAS
jgi:hypothetical protein